MCTPALSVIIVTYDSEGVILPCLRSLYAATPDAEVIIIDNHSADNSVSRVEAFKRRHPDMNIMLIRHPRNHGYAQAVNTGLARAEGGAIMLLGPDVRLLPDSMHHLLHCLKGDSRIGIVAPRLIDAQGNTTSSVRNLPEFADLWRELSGLPRLFPGRITAAWKASEFDYDTSGPAEQPEASCLLCRNDAVRDIGPMDERFSMFFNDVDWCRRFQGKGWSIRYCHEATAVHLGGHSVYQRRLSMIWKSHQAFYRYLKKYTPPGPGQCTVAVAGLSLLVAAAIRSILWSMGNTIKKM